MTTSKRRLRSRELQEDLKGYYDCHLLQGLNGRHLAPREPESPDAVLPRNPAAISRIETFLIDLQAAAEPPSVKHMVGYPDPQEFIKRANAQLRKYLRFPQVAIDTDSGALTSKMERFVGDEWEQGAITSILGLLDDGELWRLMRCACCGQWLYSLRSDQQYCGTACRQKEHSQSTEFKERRARYMREKFRPREKRRDARARRQAAQVLREGRK